MTVPTIEPLRHRAGDTLAFSRSFADYPAPTWVLTYNLLSAANRYTFDAAASGSDHLVTVAAATTASWVAGGYEWVATVASGAERYEVSRGHIRLDPNVAAAADLRSHARRTLEAVEAVIEGRATKDQESYELAGRKLVRTPIADLLKLRDYYRDRVDGEETAARMRRGLGGRRRILARLG